MAISFQSIAQQCATFLASRPMAHNTVCLLTGNNTVDICAGGDVFIGVVSNSKDGLANVILSGFVTLPYTGANPSTGFTALAADEDGGVQLDADGRQYLVVNVDTTRKLVSFYL
ncbi:MAG: hypothetical protein LBM28_01260 [Oscillospiraceae bacterium]|jgi:hypothetical protein|nr:hypothetical protein [Oscillospiraceae bacterium]